MYLPPHFAETDQGAIAEIIEAAPLACVVAQTEAGLVANHLPLLQGPQGVLIGHIAKANDMHRMVADGTDVLAVFRRDDAYVSPNYYPSKAEHHRHVPTWNYEVVHVQGRIRFQHDTQAKRAAVGLLTTRQERRLNGDKAWRMADAPSDYMAAMLEGIVALRITPERVIAKAKLSQNREARDHQGAVEGLRAAGHEELAERMAMRRANEGRAVR